MNNPISSFKNDHEEVQLDPMTPVQKNESFERSLADLIISFDQAISGKSPYTVGNKKSTMIIAESA